MGSPRYLDIVARSHGLERSKLVGRKWHELTFAATPDEAADLWNTALESHEPVRRPEVHLQFAQNEQETIWDWSLSPILDVEKEETVRFMLASAIEVTEQTLARQELEQLGLLKDDFLSLASHELRTPLSSILGNAQLLERNLQRQMKVTGDSGNSSETAKSDGDQEVQMLERIVRQVRRMDRLIDQMLDITRIRSDLFQLEIRKHVNIVEVAKRVVEQDTISTRHKLNLHIDAQELLVTCDEIRVEQVLDNLLSNAIKYSQRGTPVEVGVESRPEHKPKEVVVWVRDKGRGISEEEQLHIFDRFYRTHNKKSAKVEGLGLGLYIAHEVIHQHGGHIWLESKPGEGSTFYFSLPLE